MFRKGLDKEVKNVLRLAIEDKTMKYIRTFAIPIVLLAMAGIVGYAIYSQSSSSKAPTTHSPTGRDKQVSTPPVTSQSSLTVEQERELLKPLPADASNEEKIKQTRQIAGLTQDGTQISLGAQCRPSPMVLRTKLGSELVVTNQDGATHTLAIADQNFTVDKGVTISIRTDLFKGDFLYRYSCDNKGYVGYLIIKK